MDPHPPVGWFTESDQKVVIFAKEGESPEDAITRVATEHNTPLDQVRRGAPPNNSIPVIKDALGALIKAEIDSDSAAALVAARNVVSTLEQDMKLGDKTPSGDEEETFEAASSRRGAIESYLKKLNPPPHPANSATEAQTYAYDKLFPDGAGVI